MSQEEPRTEPQTEPQAESQAEAFGRKVALDCETTGLDPESGHRIVELGCVEIDNRVIGASYHQLINPERIIDEDTIKIHGITNEDVEGQPTFVEAWQDLLSFIQGSELIIHNAVFDLSFLDAELKRMKLAPLLEVAECSVCDTLEIARSLHPSLRNNLDALSDRYSISREQRKDRHGALIDADILARVYLAMTGGQVAMAFANQEQAALSKGIETSQIEGDFPVIRASESEVQEHDELLDWIDPQARQGALWKG